MVLKFIEWYFTVGGFATLFTFAVDFFAGMYLEWLILKGKISSSSDEVREITDCAKIEKATKASSKSTLLCTIVIWATWMYSVPLSVSQTYTWIRKLNRVKVQS